MSNRKNHGADLVPHVTVGGSHEFDAVALRSRLPEGGILRITPTSAFDDYIESLAQDERDEIASLEAAPLFYDVFELPECVPDYLPEDGDEVSEEN